MIDIEKPLRDLENEGTDELTVISGFIIRREASYF
jgi:hypothetical protein